jgi:hypothetical protein
MGAWRHHLAGTVKVPSTATPGVPQPVRGLVMDRLREFLDVVREQGHATGNFRGLLHVLIGRKITKADGTEVSNGLSWRAVAALLKRMRWDRDVVRDLGLDPDDLPPRDRQRFWYQAIVQASVDSPEAAAAGDRLGRSVANADYVVGTAPRAS